MTLAKRLPLILLPLTLAFSASLSARAAELRCFELRTYYAAPGKLDALLARFRDYTCKSFEKHGMTNIGYWLPLENAEGKLIYLLAFPNREAAAASWKAFVDDPERQAFFKKSEEKGKLVDKIESVFLRPTDFSPEVGTGTTKPARTFELRTYRAVDNKLPNLLARFRNHTCKLFENHGMTNLGYWTPADAEQGASNTLVYLLAHSSKQACEASFKAFRADPRWIKVKADSEVAAGGPLTVKDGVVSQLLRPADFSPLK